jgi:O-antigen chain-terminating methyltransferase
MKYKTFYKSFENQFRGSTDLIKERLKAYLPLVKALTDIDSNAKILDIGCGRGEWLNLLKENKIQAEGVDLDDGMLEVARIQNLIVSKEDALEKLRNAENNEYTAITGFHIIEHLPFEYLLDVINECYRVVKPGGIIIFETPNPEHLIVATRTFYLDWTHMKPIPPELLKFIYEYFNFKINYTFRLNESPINKERATIHDIFFAVSPDYSLVGQKEGSDSLKKAFKLNTMKRAGRTLEEVINMYHEKR